MDLIHYHVPKLLQIFAEKRCDVEPNDSSFVKQQIKFQVDPELLNWQILQALIVKGFQIECDFFLYYQHNSKLIPIENDRELQDALNLSSRLELVVDLVDYRRLLTMMNRELKNKRNPDNREPQQVSRCKVLSEWDIITSSDIILAQTLSMTNNFISNQIEKLKTKAKCLETISASSVATNSWLVAETIYQYLTSDESQRDPVADFWPYLDSDGRVKSLRALRVAIYRRGLDPTLRRIGWKHLLNVYPDDYTGQERIDFIRLRCETYKQMRDLWQRNVINDPEVRNICNMVRKDVRRTDRHHPFYMGNHEPEETFNSSENDQDPEDQEKNPNVTSLYNILVTYALNHKYRYCQGMSDLASPLLFVMKDESQTYITFCALMQRLGENFSTEGGAVNRKFCNLKRLLRHYDPEFFRYLQNQGAEELLFTYRWILLDLKREFPFDQVMEILEVLWASIPPSRERSGSSNVSNLMNMFDVDYLYVPNRNSNKETSSSKPETSSSGQTEGTGKLKLRSLKFLPNTLSSDSQATITDKPFITLDSPMQEGDLSQDRELPPRPWDSPNLNKQKKENCGFHDCESKFFNVGTSRFYVDNDFFFPSSSGPPSSSSSDFGGDEAKPTQPNAARNEDASSIDSGIQHRKLKNRNRKSSSCTHLHHAHCNGDDGSSTTTDDEDYHQRLREQQHKYESFAYHSLDHGYITDQKAGASSAMVPRAAELLLMGESDACPEMTGFEAQFNKLSAEGTSVSEQELNGAIRQMESLQVSSSQSSTSSTSSLELLPNADDLELVSEDFPLISPDELGANDAFMLFVCLTMLLQSRNHIMGQEMDRNDIHLYFDNMVRKHNVRTVLEDARHLFHEYLTQWRRDEHLDAQD